jgi:hypothetical protein
MRTTIDIEDSLFRKAKAEAALRGVSLRNLVEKGVQLVLATTPPKSGKRRAKLPSHGIKRLGKLNIPDDIAHFSQQQEDYARYEASR